MQFLLADVLVWGQAEDSIGVVSETLGFVKSQELEISTFVVLQLDLKLSQGGLSFFIGLQWLNASIVLPDESLQLC